MEKELIIEKLKILSQKLKRTPKKQELLNELPFSKKIIEKHFNNYNDLLREADLEVTREPNKIIKQCLHCQKEFSINKNQDHKKFCSKSCSASFNNKITKRKSKAHCKECGKELKDRNGIFCSQECQKTFNYKDFITKWKNKEVNGTNGLTLQLSPTIKRYMLEKNNFSCSICGWNKRHPVDNKPLVEIDHIDGDASNSFEENLRVLCPNCHSETPTFRARNKISSRKR